MNVLMVGLDFNPPWTEGIRNHVRLISRNLMKSGYNVHFLTKGSGDQSLYESVDGINYHRIYIGISENPSSGVFSFLWKLPFFLVKVIKKEKIDVIHGHSVYPILGVILGIISTIIGTKSVFTLYSSPKNKNSITGFSKLYNLSLAMAKNNLLVKYFLPF